MSAMAMGLLVLLALPAFGRAQEIPITECFQTVLRGATGVLQADLDCSGLNAPKLCENNLTTCTDDADCDRGAHCRRCGSVLLKGAVLKLNGFRLTGGSYAVRCARRCRVEGPGEIVARGIGISGMRWQTMATVNDVTVTGAQIGIAGAILKATDVIVRGGIDPEYEGDGFQAKSLRGANLTAIDRQQGAGFSVKRMRVDGLTATGNAFGVRGREPGRVTFQNATIVANTVSAVENRLGRCRVDDSTLTNNAQGIICKSLRIEDSIAVDNTLFDIRTFRRPRVFGTVTCGTSQKGSKTGQPLGPSWGICAND